MNKPGTILLLCALSLVSCAPRGQKAAEPRHIQEVKIPSVYSSDEEKADYALAHYWDGLLLGDGRTDTAMILGVPKAEVEQRMANYTLFLTQVPLQKARGSVGAFFNAIEKKHAADTSSHLLPAMEKIVTHYLYDPNSPMRNEDLYLPFVSRLAESEFTAANMKPAYRHDAQMCSLNQYGQQVPDFKFRTLKGRTMHLYGVRARYTMLFFSNPGCHACKGIIEEVMGNPVIPGMLSDGTLAVVNVYIDEDLDAWKAYAPTYPESWYSGYDPDYIIRQDLLFNVRAIPSLYLLDAEKRVIMKDAPTENVLRFMDNIAKER